MRLAYVLLAIAGCSSAPKPDTTTTTEAPPPETTATTQTATPAASSMPEPTSTETSGSIRTVSAAGTPTAPPATSTSGTPVTKPSQTTAPVTKPSQTSGGSAAASGKPLYSCFSYVAAGSNTKRTNCMRTDDCPAYVEQAKSIKGIRDLTGCASVATVWCFHQVVKDDPIGVDVCQPSVDECKTSRTGAVKARESVDTDCAQR
jgi:hypothetical protein